MKDIFSELYNKVLGFFRQTENKEEETAKDVACNRLKFVLMQDRTNLTPELMDRMRTELIELLSKYVEMDKEALELGFEQEGTQMALMLSIPVVRAKEESEIEAILAKEDEEKALKAQAEESSDEDAAEEIVAEDENALDESSEETKVDEDSDNDASEDLTSSVAEETESKVDESETGSTDEENEVVAVGAGSKTKASK